MINDWADLVKMFFYRRGLILNMTYKEITDRYAGSAFGLLLAVIQPLLLIGVYTLVFTFVFRVRIGGTESPTSYAFYALCGLIPWIAIAESISKSVSSVTSKSALVKQAIFPTEVLPISSVLSSLLTMLIGFSIYIIGIAIFAPGHLSWLSFLAIVVVILQIIFAIGLGWLLAVIGVYLRDIGELISVLLMIGMFVTPILYLENMIPAAFVWPMRFNPFAHLIYMYRDTLFYGKILHPWSFLIFGLLAIALFYFGYKSFKKVKIFFANVL